MSRMLYLDFSAMACWMAAIGAVLPTPGAFKTRRLMTSARGATPENEIGPAAPSCSLALIPANKPPTGVPWPTANLSS